MAEMVLCAVDGPDAAAPVLDTARWLADALRARMVVVHAVEKTDRDSEELVASLRNRLADEHAEVRLVEGSPARAILETADRENAELLVAGSRGHGPVRSAVLGSVSREIAARAPCPVVVAASGEPRAGTAHSAPNASVVCGVDGSDQALAAAAFAGRLATRLGYRLIVAHARQNIRAVVSYPGARAATPPVTGQQDAVRKLADEVIQRAEEAAGVSALGVVEPGPPVEVLVSVAERETARLIVIAARGFGALRAALLGSVAAKLPVEAASPVIVLSEPATAKVLRGLPGAARASD